MRHRKTGRKFGRTTAHRTAMSRNLVTALLAHGRIETTEARGKELRRWVERVITTAKADDLAARRQVDAIVEDRAVSEKLFKTLLPRMANRPGGYTRVLKTGPRQGDGAPMVLIELVDR
jgi:large subunit ribosomal protein L17